MWLSSSRAGSPATSFDWEKTGLFAIALLFGICLELASPLRPGIRIITTQKVPAKQELGVSLCYCGERILPLLAVVPVRKSLQPFFNARFWLEAEDLVRQVDI